ncbi:hypothetical protein [Microbacterium sp. EF45047]|uniref:hypothetical protein n=1 Tax=Microbacterium sp. EF45047 TaxID=2809708 RepID=UPI00234A37CD|nr:hypothetical protein [Microbacterium sp. EF45047]WCM56084.1 hypothetical protein JRG78_02305 [Microbacterium sp. EF45047]
MTARSVTVGALGARIRIVFGDDVPADVVARTAHAWSGASVDAAEEDAAEDARIDVPAVSDPEAFLQQLSTDVTLEALAHNRGRLLMLHAAGVALEDGRVIAFVGPSGRGKTTLSRHLARHFGYVSDETIAFDDELRVLPYRKPLSVIRHGMPKDQIAPADAGLRDLPGVPLRLAAIVVLDRDPGASGVTVEHVPFADAAPDLVAQTSYLTELPGTVSALADLCARAGGVRRLRYAEASEVPAAIERILAPGPASDAGTARQLPVLGPEGEVTSADAVDDGDRIVVLAGRTLRVLDGIAPTILRHAGEGEEAIVAAVVAAHGAPPSGDPAALVRHAMQELAEAGFVVGER